MHAIIIAAFLVQAGGESVTEPDDVKNSISRENAEQNEKTQVHSEGETRASNASPEIARKKLTGQERSKIIATQILFGTLAYGAGFSVAVVLAIEVIVGGGPVDGMFVGLIGLAAVPWVANYVVYRVGRAWGMKGSKIAANWGSAVGMLLGGGLAFLVGAPSDYVLGITFGSGLIGFILAYHTSAPSWREVKGEEAEYSSRIREPSRLELLSSQKVKRGLDMRQKRVQIPLLAFGF